MEHLIEAILRIIWFPYEAWRQSNENSRIGTSELDRKTARFWKRVAITITALLVLGVLVLVPVFVFF